MAGMQRSNDAEAELLQSRIHRDSDDLRKVINIIMTSADPFNLESELLIDIYTGKSATLEISNSLLSIEEEGVKRHIVFIHECADDPARFERAIPQSNLKTFVVQGAKNKRSHDAVIRQLRCTRDMLGRIAVIATKKTVDLEFLLTYPLTSVPLSLCRTDGTMVHTDKSALFSMLEEKVQEHGIPKEIHSHLIDGNFLLYSLPTNLPPSYSGLSRVILHTVLDHPSKRVDIVFDPYEKLNKGL